MANKFTNMLGLVQQDHQMVEKGNSDNSRQQNSVTRTLRRLYEMN